MKERGSSELLILFTGKKEKEKEEEEEEELTQLGLSELNWSFGFWNLVW
jgi:hypothetical protein